MPKTLYKSAISKQTKRTPARVVGYYTAQEAAKQLGVDVATLKYRRDHAVAGEYLELLGVQKSHPMFAQLAKSHMIYVGKHYYKKAEFNAFVHEYVNRPQVISARRRRTVFPTVKQAILEYNITSQKELERAISTLTTLFQSDQRVSFTVYA